MTEVEELSIARYGVDLATHRPEYARHLAAMRYEQRRSKVCAKFARRRFNQLFFAFFVRDKFQKGFR